MRGSKRAIVALCSALLPWGTAPAEPVSGTMDELLNAALAGEHRSEEQVARDIYRHPGETLRFFGLRADMTVVEIWPGGGWYTAVLAPVLRSQGQLVVATYSEAPPDYRPRVYKEFRKRLEGNTDVFDKVDVVLFEPPKRTVLGPPNSADMVVTFRNAHNWINHDIADTVFTAMFTVLKPGGVLGLVQHRAPADADPKASAERGYVPEKHIIALAEAAGFEFAVSSEINANPKDTADYPEGVWTLPPSLTLDDEDRERYVAIGESDRMTLRFVKPVR